jgi:hypothetical protein
MPYTTDIPFDIDQKVFVFLDDKSPLRYIPCVPLDTGSVITRIPHLSWIKYRGIARLYDGFYMRFIYEEEYVYIGLACLPYLENIRQKALRKPGRSNGKRRGGSRKVSSVKPRSMRYRRKPGGLSRKIRTKQE